MSESYTFAEASPAWNYFTSQLAERLACIPPRSRLAILFGADADGFISYLFLKKILTASGHTIAHAQSFLTYQYLFSDFIEQRAEEYDTIITLDIPVIQEFRRFAIRYPDVSQIIIDHHLFHNRLPESDHLYYFNHVFENIDIGRRAPVCLLMYSLLQQVAPTNKYDALMLAAGLQGDSALHDYPELTSYLATNQVKATDKNQLETDQGLITRAITSSFQLTPNGAPIDWIETAYLLGTILSTTNTNRLKETAARFERSVGHEFANALKTANCVGAFLYYKLTGHEFVSNIVCRRLSNEFRKLICIVEYDDGNITQFEFRAADRQVNIPSILAQSKANQHTLSIGGHPTACGAIVAKKNRKRFLMAIGLK